MLFYVGTGNHKNFRKHFERIILDFSHCCSLVNHTTNYALSLCCTAHRGPANTTCQQNNGCICCTNQIMKKIMKIIMKFYIRLRFIFLHHCAFCGGWVLRHTVQWYFIPALSLSHLQGLWCVLLEPKGGLAKVISLPKIQREKYKSLLFQNHKLMDFVCAQPLAI